MKAFRWSWLVAKGSGQQSLRGHTWT